MLIKHENKGTYAICHMLRKDMFEEGHSDKLKAAKCYIKEMNNNRDEDSKNTKEDPQLTLTNKKSEIQLRKNKYSVNEGKTRVKQTKHSNRSTEFGFSNPFQPGGCVSGDADLIVKMWKEERLSELYCHKGTEQGDEEDGENTDRDHNKNGVETINANGDFKNLTKADNFKNSAPSENVKKKNKKEKFKSLCCSFL
eukprot:GFUD01020716.1.p1 GENE.GFUD01020716.1~~GFUD01020716.1.p1  ORF type:complete len:196 (-),score=59.56 GFUD01020716.1:146-733(-)